MSEIAAELEHAIHAYISRMPVAERAGSGRLYIKLDLGEPQLATPERRIGVLFLSMPRLEADKEWLTKLMAYVRDGFEGGQIETGGRRVTLDADQDFESFHDEEAGTVLLNLAATCIVEAEWPP